MMDFDDSADKIRVTIDNNQQPSTTIVEVVAAATNRSITECPPLYNQVNPDALDVVFDDRGGGRIIFEYADCQVTVFNDTAVTIVPD